MQNDISIYLEVFNEEGRIEKCLKSFLWANQIVVFVKKSSDNTLEIAKKFATHVYEVDYCDGNQNLIANLNSHHWNNWILFCTASSYIDQSLVPLIIEKTNSAIRYDAIGLPYNMTVFGISGKSSPWGAPYKYGLIRKSSLVVREKLHREFSWTGDSITIIDKNLTKGRFHHNTHLTPNNFFSKHLRYVQIESEEFILEYGKNAYKFALIDFLKSIAYVSIKKRSLYYGKDGFILSIAYITYFFNRMLYIWFKLKCKKSN